MANQSVTYNSTSTLGILGIILVVFKIFGYIQWSWWLVLLPFYGPMVVIFGVLFIIGLVGLIAAVLS